MDNEYTETNLELAEEANLEIAAAQEETQGDIAVSALSVIQPDRPDQSYPVQNEIDQYPEAPVQLLDTNEIIHMNSGAMELCMTDLRLPGKNGFDLIVQRRYNSQEANTEMIDVSCTDQRIPMRYIIVKQYGQELYWMGYYHTGDCIELTQDLAEAKASFDGYPSMSYGTNGTNVYNSTTSKIPNNHLLNTFGLGYGWSFVLPSIESKQEYSSHAAKRTYYVLHLGDGRAFRYKKTSSSDGKDSNLQGHPLMDLRLEERPVSDTSYRFILHYKDGKKAFFRRDNLRLSHMEDRFGNKISYQFSSAGRLEAITDTYGRILRLLTESGGMYWRFDGQSSRETTYLISNSRLTGFLDKLNRQTTYTYTNQAARALLFDTMGGDTPQNITYVNLTQVTHPTGAVTKYTYTEIGEAVSNPIRKPFQRYFGLSRRCDQESATGVEKNVSTYSYTMHAKSKHHVGQAVHAQSGKKTVTYEFDNKQLLVKETVQSSGKKYTEKTYIYGGRERNDSGALQPDYNLPVWIEEKQFNPDNAGAAPMLIVNEFTYTPDCKGNVATQKDICKDTAGVVLHSQTTSMVYDSNYSILTRKTYYQASDAASDVVTETYTLSSTHPKAIGAQNIGNLEIRNYEYDGSYRLIKEMVKVDSSNNLIISYGYDNSLFTPEPVSKTVAGVKDIDSQPATGTPGQTAGTIREVYSYDYYGCIVSKTDANGNKTSYTYDALGRVVEESYPLSQKKQMQYIDTQNHIVITNENGAKTRYEYTSLGRIARIYAVNGTASVLLCSYEYDNFNRLKYEKTYKADGSVKATATYTYDAFDRITAKTVTGTSVNYAESYVYRDGYMDPAAPNTRCIRVEKTILADNDSDSIVTASHMDQLGRVIAEYEGGYKTAYTYDKLGNCISRKDAKGHTTSWNHDCFGRVVKETTPLGHTSTTYYNMLGQITAAVDFRGGCISYTYDILGRLLNQKSAEKMRQVCSDFFYDAAGNLTKQRTYYSGSNIDTKLLRIQEYTYDARGRLLSAKDGLDNTVNYIYDGVGNCTIIKAANFQTTKYEYNRFRSVTKITDHLEQSEQYMYDAVGVLLRKTDRNGNMTSYEESNSRDALDRVLREKIISPDGTVKWIFSTYSRTGTKLEEKNDDVQITYHYNSRGILKSQTEVSSDLTIEKTYEYDQNGNRSSFSITMNGANILRMYYEYDAMDRLWKVRRDSVTSQPVAQYTYDQSGNRTKLERPGLSGVITNYTYNADNLITSLTHMKGTTTLSSCSYVYGYDGNVVKSTERGREVSYIYDAADQLKQEIGKNGDTITYTYDSVGNRTKKDVSGKPTTSYSYDWKCILLSESTRQEYTSGHTPVEGYTYRYDNNGNQIFQGWQKYGYSSSGTVGFVAKDFYLEPDTFEMREYDAYNRLRTVRRDRDTTRYTYRPDGLRHQKESGGQTTVHLWDGGNMVAELTESTVNGTYLWGAGLISGIINGTTYVYLHNGHGDVMQLANINGVVQRNYTYDAFGNDIETTKTGDMGSAGTVDTNPFRYCAEYWDSETNTYYLRARSYVPRLGRFTQEDIARDGLNWYTYCGNSPIRYIDPSGNFKWDLTEKEMKSVNYDPWAMEALAVKKSFKSEWSGTYYSSHMKYEGIEVSYQFKIKVLDVCEELGIKPDDLMTLMATESKIATRESPYGGRGGLLQFTSSTAKRMGYTLNEITSMDGLQQLDVVRDFFKLNLDTYKKADPQNIIDLYTLMFLPSGGGFGQGDNFEVMSTTNANYGGNSAMNVDKVGGISRGDLRAWIALEMEKYRNNRR